MHPGSTVQPTNSVQTILSALGFEEWDQHPLQGDASSRQFIRLSNPDGRTAIMMMTPPEQHDSETAFLKIQSHLAGIGLCAPKVLAHDIKSHTLILEDLGRTDIAAKLRSNHKEELALYQCAIDVLLHLQRSVPPTCLNTLTADTGVKMLAPFFDHYVTTGTAAQRDTVERILHQRMTENLDADPVLSLRDYHAENLIWRPDQDGLSRIGLIDFQDAFLAGPEYDLISLLRDARRDVGPQTYDHCIAYFAAKTGKSLVDLQRQCAVTAVQRNLRILGIFARLAEERQKPAYLRLVPRVLGHIMTDLTHPELHGLRQALIPLLDSQT